MSEGENRLGGLVARIRQLKQDRNWEQFHTPKNLAISLVCESAELLEIFRWKEHAALSEAEIKKLKEEIGDVVVNLFNLCDTLGVDPFLLASAKLNEIEKKYSIEKFKDRPDKYH